MESAEEDNVNVENNFSLMDSAQTVLPMRLPEEFRTLRASNVMSVKDLPVQ
jgi:hypothetical protein